MSTAIQRGLPSPHPTTYPLHRIENSGSYGIYTRLRAGDAHLHIGNTAFYRNTAGVSCSSAAMPALHFLFAHSPISGHHTLIRCPSPDVYTRDNPFQLTVDQCTFDGGTNHNYGAKLIHRTSVKCAHHSRPTSRHRLNPYSLPCHRHGRLRGRHQCHPQCFQAPLQSITAHPFIQPAQIRKQGLPFLP